MLKIKMLLVYIFLSVNISTVIADDNVLTVWEDKGKSLAIVNQIAEFEKNNNCIVKIFEKDAEKQLDLIMTNNGQTPDVFILISDRLIDAYSNKIVREIDYSQEDRDLYETSALNALSVANKVYAAPRSIESLVIYYNKDLLEYPYETLEEYADSDWLNDNFQEVLDKYWDGLTSPNKGCQIYNTEDVIIEYTLKAAN